MPRTWVSRSTISASDILLDRRVGGDRSVQGAGGQVFQGAHLVPGDARGAQHFVRRVEQQLRGRVAAIVLADAPVDGGSRLAVQLLVEDRLQQRLKRRLQRVQPQRERAGPVDQCAQLGVARAQMRQSLGGVEGEFRAAAIVNHRGTVYRAESSFRQDRRRLADKLLNSRPINVESTAETNEESNAMKMRPGTQTGFLLCGKEWMDGDALEVRSPWDKGLVGRVTIATRADARQAVHHAVASLRRARALPRWKRREILEDVAAALIEQKERFAQLIVAEAGKPVRMARAEVDRAVLTFKTAAEEASRLGGESLPLDLMEGNEGRWGLVQRFPVGPVLAITPFNFPLNLVAHKLAPAMAAGCPVILKPAPQTPFTALALGEVILKAGWPAEALAVLPLSNADTAWLAEKEDSIKLVSFTGSSQVGWELKARSGRKRVLLELGGNAALIVHGDWPDLDEAALRTASRGLRLRRPVLR